MRRSVFAVYALAAAANLVIAGGAVAQSKRSFTIVNSNSTVSVQRVWTATAGTNDAWVEANLDAPIRTNGGSSFFTMPPSNICFIDVKVQFSDDYVQTFANVNACRAAQVTAR